MIKTLDHGYALAIIKEEVTIKLLTHPIFKYGPSPMLFFLFHIIILTLCLWWNWPPVGTIRARNTFKSYTLMSDTEYFTLKYVHVENYCYE